jgi:hypothetical protein
LDGDLELANNYNSVHQGSEQAGYRFRGLGLDHHTMWYEGKQLWHWFQFYESWGKPYPVLKKGVQEPPAHPELPWNVPGLALLLAPFLFPFRGTTYLEPAALLLSAAAAFGSFWCLRRILSKYLDDTWKVNMIAAFSVLGTPLWHYSRTLFPEGFLAFFLLACLWLYFEERFFSAGIFLAVAIFVKPPIGLAGLPLLAEMLLRKRFQPLLLFSVPLAISTAAFFAVNAGVYGGPLNAPSDIYFQLPFRTLLWQMVSFRGIVPFVPIIVLAFAGWPAFFRLHRREAILLLACFCMWYFFIASLESWEGGYSYGPRFMVPIIPLLLVGLAGFFHSPSKGKLFAFYWMGALSIVLNGLGSIPYWKYWSMYPPAELFDQAFK